jgi:hypothetical protein
MNYNKMQELATKNNFGYIQWEEKIALNTGKPMEVGYVWIDGYRELFCKRSMNTEFRLCNQFDVLAQVNV